MKTILTHLNSDNCFFFRFDDTPVARLPSVNAVAVETVDIAGEVYVVILNHYDALNNNYEQE